MLFKQFLLVQTIKYLTLYDSFVWSEQTKRIWLCETKVKISYEISSSRINNYPNHLL